ncbi:UNVERIFIED_CONTAM: hypothetical protein FKN15_025821 [Acipenser sinensis]
MALLWLLIALGALSSSLGDEESLVRTRRGTRMYREYCKDWLSTEVHRHGETWLRWHGQSVEYCRCANRKSRCHAVPVEECSRSRCYNGGSCKQALHSPEFICRCPSGFVGPQCEIEYCKDWLSTEVHRHGETWLRWHGQSVEYCRCANRKSRCHAVPVEECSRSRCYNGGSCKQALHSPEFICRCPSGFVGPQCEIDTTEKCISGRGGGYRGTWGHSRSSIDCLNWNSSVLIDKKYNARRNDALQLGLGNHNYCRNPDNDTEPWCHVYKNKQLVWEYCSVPSCPQGDSAECYAGTGSSYRGSRSSTHTGARCLSWDSPALAKKAYNAWRADARQLGLGSHNHCRNPDNDSKPWCHVYRGRALTWEHCDLPKCVDRPVSSSTVGSSGFLSGHDNAVESCGKRLPPVSQYRIKGGQVSSIAAHPWQAALFVYNRKAHADSYFCGGVLIGSCWLLSAAHCFQERFRPNLLKVVMGRTYRLQSSTNEQIFRVEKYFVHEQYDEETFDNDIGQVHVEHGFGHLTGNQHPLHRLAHRLLGTDRDLEVPQRAALAETDAVLHIDRDRYQAEERGRKRGGEMGRDSREKERGRGERRGEGEEEERRGEREGERGSERGTGEGEVRGEGEGEREGER